MVKIPVKMVPIKSKFCPHHLELFVILMLKIVKKEWFQMAIKPIMVIKSIMVTKSIMVKAGTNITTIVNKIYLSRLVK